MADPSKPNLFQKGNNANPKGRGKGVQNKVNQDVREMINKALSNAGGVKYLTEQAEKNPVAFMALVARILPKEMNVNVTAVTQDLVDVMQKRRDQLAEMRDVTDVIDHAAE